MTVKVGYQEVKISNTAYMVHTTGDPRSRTFTIPPGRKRLLIVTIATRNNRGSSVKFNGKALSLAKRSSSYDGCQCDIWYMVSPDVGAHTLIVDLIGASQSMIGIVCATGIDQVNPVLLTGESSGTGTTRSKALTNTILGALGVDAQYNNGNAAGTQGADQTIIYKDSVGPTADDSGGMSYRDDMPESSVNFSWSGLQASSTGSSMALAFFKPARRSGGAIALLQGIFGV